MSEISNNATKLLELSPVAIASQSFLTAFGPIHTPQGLLQLPLLHQRNHWGWLDWFAAMDVPIVEPLPCSVFEDASVLLRGASQGQGAVIGWLPLIDQDLTEGRVIRLFNETIAATHSYFIELGGISSAKREVQQMLDWLMSETGQ